MSFDYCVWYAMLFCTGPPPRDALDESGQHIKFDNTGNKYAACGPESGKWGFGSITTLSPGWTTISW